MLKDEYPSSLCKPLKFTKLGKEQMLALKANIH